MKTWQNLEKIFIGTSSSIDSIQYGTITKEWIEKNNPEFFDSRSVRPIGKDNGQESLIYELIIRYHSDGRVEKVYPYTTEWGPIDGKTILNPIGVKIFRQARENALS